MMDTPKRLRPSEPSLSFNTSFREAYVQTRHKNLRCFPVCASVHMEKSFCGKIIEVAVTFPKDFDAPSGKPMLIGEFRCTTIPQSVEVGGNIESIDLRNSKFIVAELVVSGSRDLRFVINPNRKWFYPRTTSEGEMHCYTVYLVMDDTVIAQLDSPPFKVLPIWKEERRPSMLGLPAGPKSATSPRNSRHNEDDYDSEASRGSSPPSMPTSPSQLANLAMQYNLMRQQDPSNGNGMSWASSLGLTSASNQPHYFRQYAPGMTQNLLPMVPPFQPQFTPVSSSMTSHQVYQPYYQVPTHPRSSPPAMMQPSALPHFAPPSHRSLTQRFLAAQQHQPGPNLEQHPQQWDAKETKADAAGSANGKVFDGYSTQN